MTQREIVDRELEEKEEEIKQEMKHLIEKIVSMIQLEIHDTAHWLSKTECDKALFDSYQKADKEKDEVKEIAKKQILTLILNHLGLEISEEE